MKDQSWPRLVCWFSGFAASVAQERGYGSIVITLSIFIGFVVAGAIFPWREEKRDA